MSLSGLIQFLLGFIVGISLLVGSGTAVAYYLFTRMSANPPKPIFSEEKQEQQTTTAQRSSKKPSSSTSAEEQKLEPPGTYRARVTWSEGLSLRDEPSLEANRVGGIGYNTEVIVLKESNDQNWQKIRLPDSEQEGWVKAGNLRKVDEEEY